MCVCVLCVKEVVNMEKITRILVTPYFRGLTARTPIIGSHNSEQTCGGDLSSPLQRVASRFVRSQVGGTAWLEGKALPFKSRAAPTCSADAAAAYERSVDAGAS